MQYIIEVVNTKLGENYHTVVDGLTGVSNLVCKLNKLKDEHVITVNPVVFRNYEEVEEELTKELKPKDLEFGGKKTEVR